ncbi:rhomboid family intramembrane serine protease [Nocardioides cynanchi]|uniref:rhomboid family intramembrane serine protease n=1 Tax=Nocardioides cynanchi TaxID=2558918 RepID=UPI001245A8C9|nr:rhomboid family intramembrane serine protease [Nocardioides cynanchi]
MTPAEGSAGVPTCYRHPGRETYIRCQRCEKPICPDCMRDAAVGFQCPSCIAQGKKDTRSGRTPYGGARPANPGVVSRTLIAVNLAVWVLIISTGGATSTWVERLALTPRVCSAGDHPGSYYPRAVTEAQCALTPDGHWGGVAGGDVWQLLTSMFAHVEIWHIGFNMIALWVLGPQLELVLGRLRFIGLYLLSGLVGSAVVYWLSTPDTPTLGASGALFGLMGALIVLALKVKADVRPLLGWVGLNFALTFLGRGFISWQGHLGGFLGGVVLAAVLAYAPRERRTTWQAAGFGAVALLVVLAVVARTATLN